MTPPKNYPPNPLSKEAMKELEAMFAEHKNGIIQILRAMCGDDDLARDLCQETYHAVARQYGKPSCSIYKAGYFYKAAYTACMDHYRRENARKRGGGNVTLNSQCELQDEEGQEYDVYDITPHPDASQAFKHILDKEWCRYLLSALKPEQRALVHLHIDMQYTHQKIAAILGISERTVQYRLGCSYKILRAKAASEEA